MKIVIASNNPGKLKEIQAILADSTFELLLPRDLGYYLEVEETGSTYPENARLKAVAHAQKSGLLAMADDSGLEVDALGGAPGLHSARYHPAPEANDADRRSFLLQKVQKCPRPWLAHFHCTSALADPAGQVWYAEGNCPGEIIPTELGDNGFGYDPIFIPRGEKLTAAQIKERNLPLETHRTKALRALFFKVSNS